MSHTKQKNEPLTPHEEFLSGMSKQDRILHTVAGAMALHQQFTDVMESVAEQVDDVGDLRQHAVAMPAILIAGMTEVMGEMIAIMESELIVTREKVEAFVEKKIMEREAKSKADGKPEGWCESCQRVHEKRSEENMSPIAQTIMSMLAAIVAERVQRDGEQSNQPAPPNTTLH